MSEPLQPDASESEQDKASVVGKVASMIEGVVDKVKDKVNETNQTTFLFL